MSEITDGQRLLGRGTTIKLADGAAHEIRFSNRALVRIESDWGSLSAFAEGIRSKPFSTIAYAIHLTLGVTQEQAIDLVDTRHIKAYCDAVGSALELALPDQTVKVRIVQAHEIAGDHYRAGTVVEVPSDRAKHLLEARVAEVVQGNEKAAPGSESPGAASSALPSSDGTSIPSDSGISLSPRS